MKQLLKQTLTPSSLSHGLNSGSVFKYLKLNLFMAFAWGCCQSSSLVHAEEHPLTKIEGNQISLMAADHSVAGSVGNHLIFASKDEETGTSTLNLKLNGKVIQTLFGPQSSADGTKNFGGTITTNDPEKKTELKFVSVIPSEQKIILLINGAEAIVSIKADKYENNHFYNPQYTVKWNGLEIAYQFPNGVACYGYSTHLAFWILGAYVHGSSRP